MPKGDSQRQTRISKGEHLHRLREIRKFSQCSAVERRDETCALTGCKAVEKRRVELSRVEDSTAL